MLSPKNKQLLLDTTLSIGFAFFLIAHTRFNTISVPWFLVLCGFNILIQVYRKLVLTIKDEQRYCDRND
jgi:hypothetical protein